MKKILVTLVLIAGITTSLFSFEWGGHFNNTTRASTTDFEAVNLNQSNSLSISFSGALTKDKSLRFVTEGLYKYNLGIPVTDTSFVNIIDLPLLKIAGSWGGPGSFLQLNLGRFGFSDKTGQVFSQTSDGINVSYSSYEWIVGMYAGYTGLLNRFNVSMIDNQFVKNNTDQLYDLSYGYVPLMVDFTFTNIGDSSLGMQLQYYLDATENRNDKAYVNLTSSGPIAGFGTYYIAATLGTTKFENLMLRAALDLSFHAGKNYIFNIGADYVSGKNEVFSPFVGISQLPVHSTIMGIGLDSFVPRLSAMFVYNNFIVKLDEKLVMVIPEKIELNGLDSSLSLVYNVFRDLKLSASVNAYTDFRSEELNNFSAGLNVDFTF